MLSSKIPGVTGTYRRPPPGPVTSTTYPPGRASSAVTGTASTPRAAAVVMYTVTGAWSRLPAAAGSVSLTCTGIVVLVVPSDDVDVAATVPTEDSTPGVDVPSGSVTLT